jgi:oxygen-dependent protoporphyrinogen oxidase
MGRLTDALAAGLPEGSVRTGTTVRALRRTPTGFELVTGATTDEHVETADAVVVAVPGAPAARLLTDLAPSAAAELAGIGYASMAVITLAVRAAEASVLTDSGASGFLVPPVDGRSIKAATFSFAKWGWVRAAGQPDGLLLLRASLGRYGEEATLQRDDDELVELALGDLHAATGLTARPVDRHVQRWGGGLPQYAVGHLERVARVRADVARTPGLAVAGAAYDGVGIAACIASGHRAAADLVRGTMEP